MDRRQSSARCELGSGRFARAHKSGSVVRRSDGDSLRALSLREICCPTQDILHLTARKPAYTTRQSLAGETVSLKGARCAESPPATKALDPDPFPCRSLRHVVYAALLHFGLETASVKRALRTVPWAQRKWRDGCGTSELLTCA